MAVVLEQPELLLERESAAAGVEDPTRLDLPLVGALLAAERVRDLVLVVAQLDVPHAGAADEVDPGCERLLAEEVLEAAAVELVGVDGQAPRRAALDALGELAVVPGGEPEAQAVLRDLLVLEVLPEAEHVREVLAGDLLGRLAHLEGRLARRPLALLGDEDAGVGALLLELQTEGQPGEAAAEDRDVVAVGRLLIVAHVALSPTWRVTRRGDPNPSRSVWK